MRFIDKVIVHCADTKPRMDIGVDEIRQWHLARGWDDVGYHYVIRRGGVIEIGRDMELVGAHTLGHNTGSIGVCLVGGMDESGESDTNFTAEQYLSLLNLLKNMRAEFPNATYHGHREFSDKDCPCFDVKAFVENFIGGKA